MGEHPWSADRELDLPQVRSAIRSQFEDIPAARVSPMGSGWDNDVFLVDEEWVFRFPRRRDVAANIEREVVASSLARDGLARLDIGVPDIRRIGRPTDAFPYPFSGYRKLPGAAAPDLPDLDSGAIGLGAQIGRLLSQLHRVSPGRVHRAALDVDDDGPREWYEEAVGIVEDLVAREGRPLRPYVRWLRDHASAPPAYEGPPVFLHNDLCPDHVLIDPEDQRVTGLLDFGDAAVGDPALDFVMLPAWLGPAGARAALDRYELERDEGLEIRVSFLARVTSFVWLHDAHRQGADVRKHREWVRRAFIDHHHSR